MFRKFTFILAAYIHTGILMAQTINYYSGVPDSVVQAAHASYDHVSGVHRWLFGENYRKEWAQPTKLPVLHLSQWHGGLTPVKQGGGMESKSLRLIDKAGQEWVLRSVEKVPDKLLPENLQGTFAVDWVGDEFSAQHPYSALIVPPLAEAAGVPHANPVIGVVADDPTLGEFRKIFTGMICLLEEREPTGPSDNTIKMENNLVRTYDNRVDGGMFLRARLLDLLTGDWDRHEDQWRWMAVRDGKEKLYQAVPRDRDQVFHINQGLFPSIAALPWIDPVLGNFEGQIKGIKYALYKTRFMKAFPDMQLSYPAYMQIVQDFVLAETDEVLESGLKRLPLESYRYRHDELLTKLKKRRDHIPEAMAAYYRFINRVVDIHTTDKDELVSVTDAPEQGMRIAIDKLDKNGKIKGKLMEMVYHPEITQEVRVYVAGGDDHIVINTSLSSIRLRFIDSTGNKTYEIKEAARKIFVYGQQDNLTILGKATRLSSHVSGNSLAGKFKPVNLYNTWTPLVTGGINPDDGLLIGLGFIYTGVDGFRKTPYSTRQQVMLTHSFATQAFDIKYKGEWIRAFGKADIVLQADIQAPDNATNFFGGGNETVLIKDEGYRKFHRIRYDTYELDPALRWHTGAGSTLSIGPSFQFYHMNPEDNAGRFIMQTAKINAYDSATVNQDKAHLGFLMTFTSNQRNNNVLPYRGFYAEVVLQGYDGLNQYSRSYAQIRPEFTYYLPLNTKGTIVLSDRIGGGITIGSPAFYQSMFLGGQGNLLGFVQNRFAGQNMTFNNLQGRMKLADIASYIIPGQLGLIGFYDTGRVWVNSEHSDKWHQGIGGGVYFAPASLTVLQILAGHSEEGWYPYISLNFRL